MARPATGKSGVIATTRRVMSRKKNVAKKNAPKTAEGVIVKNAYCRMCMQIKTLDNFLEATDTFLDKNGKMSVCKNCANEIFDSIFAIEKDVSKTLYKVCKILNVLYDMWAIENTVAHVSKIFDKNGGKLDGVFVYYRSKLANVRLVGKPKTFNDAAEIATDQPLDDSIDGVEYLKQFWGEGFSFRDYSFLEKELLEWKLTHKSDTKSELTLLKEICIKELEIRNARSQQLGVDTLLESLQRLMKTANVDPAKATVANSGKSQTTFSSFIKIIEEKEPAEVFEDKNLFKDYYNIDWYFKKYVTRPLKNFIGYGSPDFNLDKDEDDDDNYFIDDDLSN